MLSNESSLCAIIDEGCRFEGNLSFQGVVRISGIVTGTIFSNDTLIITESAVINADINASIILISGTVKGDIRASSRVEIRKPARFEGSVTTPSLIVEEGVIFHGVTKMKDNN